MPKRLALSIFCLLGAANCRVDSACRDLDLTCSWPAAILFSRVVVPKFVMATNVTSASISVYSVNKTTGALSAVPGSPFATGTNPKFAAVDPTGSFVYVVHQVSPTINGYAISSTGVLTPISGSPFPAVTNLYTAVVHPTGRFLYAGSQTAASIYGYSINQTTGALTQLSSSPYAALSFPGAVTIDPSGKFLLAGIDNNPNGKVSVYAVAADGSLSQIAGSPYATGATASSVAADPFGRFAYAVHYFSNDVYAFAMNAVSGALTQAGSPVAAGLSPAYVYPEPLGRFVYASNSGDGTGSAAISGYSVNQVTGALATISGSPFTATANATGSAADPSGKFLYSANNAAITLHFINQTTGALTLAGTIVNPPASAIAVVSRSEY